MAVARPVRRKKEFSPPLITWEDVQKISEQHNEPDWLREFRADAWKIYESLPMPTTEDEPWRRTDYRHIDWESAGVITPPDGKGVEVIPAENRAPLIGDEQGALIAWVDGKLVHREINNAIESQGVLFMDLREAAKIYPDLVRENLFTKAVLPDEGKFAALNAAAWTHGVFVYIPKNVHIPLPLHSIFYNSQSGASLGHVLIVMEKGSDATILQEFLSPDARKHASYIGATELLVGDNANLKYVSLQNWGHHTFEFSHQRARVGRDSKLDCVVGTMGSKLTKAFLEIMIDGQGAWSRMSGMYFTDSTQFIDHDTLQVHNAPNTTSDLLFKGALTGNSRTVWQGMIRVMEGAQKSDGFQANRNLLMRATARADSIPGLEIKADDVRCTHAATVGKLDEEPLFYLQTRGIPRSEAERLVVNGYFWDVLERIPFEDVQRRLLQDVDRKLLKGWSSEA
ncbi:MAG TPA: Fe-S cluster assembly protein SufD [Aggregatilineales bacterium]|nr:Fe-S cluster assembly protein SufD [Aggregatilineales bacterium]